MAALPGFDELPSCEPGERDEARKPASAEDRRVRKTRLALKNALVRLLRERPLQDVTTSELCREADINRNTFYAHYRTPADVFDDIQEEYFDTIRAYVRKVEVSSLYEATCAILRATKDNRAFAVIASQSVDAPPIASSSNHGA
ncbi:TetR/AcrR family transcriptional regulator [Adlercreutzia sp. ZJ473]|uniref:TetR/AcrR family transcriptional regulator n=1 Tax=Adlercreutzia sp. ZJ473 TaxID=2722822 RepID=UPI0015545713